MHSRIALIALSIAPLFISSTMATICWGKEQGLISSQGTGPTNNVAWIDGTTSCHSWDPKDVDLPGAVVVINQDGQNPCGIEFNLDNSGFHSGYALQGCGGVSLWLDQNGQFNSACSPRPNYETPCPGMSQIWCCS